MSLDGPAALVLLRGLHVAALLVLFGSLGFAALALRRAGAPGMHGAARRMAVVAAGLALGLGAAWFLAEAALLSGADGLEQAVAAVPAMLAYLGFARWLLLRLGLLVLMLAGLAVTPADGLRGGRLVGLTALAGVALGVQPWLGHAGAAGGVAGWVLPATEVVHLLGAGLWLGGLPALLAVLVRRHAADPETCLVLWRFSAISLVAVLAIAASGAVQGWFLVGDVPRLTGTGYGRAVLLKTALFVAALALAAANRQVLLPRLADPAAGAAWRRLRGTVWVEAALGLAIVLAAGWLSGLPPGADQTAAAQSWPWLPAGLILLLAIAGALWFARPADLSSFQPSEDAHDRPPSC